MWAYNKKCCLPPSYAIQYSLCFIRLFIRLRIGCTAPKYCSCLTYLRQSLLLPPHSCFFEDEGDRTRKTAGPQASTNSADLNRLIFECSLNPLMSYTLARIGASILVWGIDQGMPGIKITFFANCFLLRTCAVMQESDVLVPQSRHRDRIALEGLLVRLL